MHMSLCLVQAQDTPSSSGNALIKRIVDARMLPNVTINANMETNRTLKGRFIEVYSTHLQFELTALQGTSGWLQVRLVIHEFEWVQCRK